MTPRSKRRNRRSTNTYTVLTAAVRKTYIMCTPEKGRRRQVLVAPRGIDSRGKVILTPQSEVAKFAVGNPRHSLFCSYIFYNSPFQKQQKTFPSDHLFVRLSLL